MTTLLRRHVFKYLIIIIITILAVGAAAGYKVYICDPALGRQTEVGAFRSSQRFFAVRSGYSLPLSKGDEVCGV